MTPSNIILHTTMPAEWQHQSAVQITWPSPHTDWVDILDEVERCYRHIACEISKRQILVVACENITETKEKLSTCNQQHIRFAETMINDTWARDHSGITIFEEGNPVILDFTFNGWGLKFPANYDNQITKSLFDHGVFHKNVTLRNMKHIVLEGGSIESDGRGALLTTEQCLLNKNRNSWMGKKEIEQLLIETLGVRRILWLRNGHLAGDDTDSHIDTLARFCSSSTIAFVRCENPEDEHFTTLSKMEEELKAFRQENGEPYELIPLPLPEAIYEGKSRLPATYANFLIINDAVLVPLYNQPSDMVALSQLKKAFPEREIIGIDCTPLIRQHGSLHCITMQYPEGVVV